VFRLVTEQVPESVDILQFPRKESIEEAVSATVMS
jgi:hypothetical protein